MKLKTLSLKTKQTFFFHVNSGRTSAQLALARRGFLRTHHRPRVDADRPWRWQFLWSASEQMQSGERAALACLLFSADSACSAVAAQAGAAATANAEQSLRVLSRLQVRTCGARQRNASAFARSSARRRTCMPIRTSNNAFLLKKNRFFSNLNDF